VQVPRHLALQWKNLGNLSSSLSLSLSAIFNHQTCLWIVCVLLIKGRRRSLLDNLPPMPASSNQPLQVEMISL
jgi:hypothetical protein